MSMEKCPRCGFMADAVETIKAPRIASETAAPIFPQDRGTGDGTIPTVQREDLEYKQWET